MSENLKDVTMGNHAGNHNNISGPPPTSSINWGGGRGNILWVGNPQRLNVKLWVM